MGCKSAMLPILDNPNEAIENQRYPFMGFKDLEAKEYSSAKQLHSPSGWFFSVQMYPDKSAQRRPPNTP